MYDLPFVYIILSWVPHMILQGRSGSFTVMDLNKCVGGTQNLKFLVK